MFMGFIGRRKFSILSAAIAFLGLLTFISCQSHEGVDKQLAADLPEHVDFNFHIRPILSDRCYKCHGPDNKTRETEWRIDQESSAFARLKETNGYAIVPGNLKKSVLWRRINSLDPELQMPPPESHLILSPRERALIGKWISQGATWKDHWSFVAPIKPTPPDVTGSIVNEIDQFIQARLTEIDLSPTIQADPERLMRRVTLDLTGLPPTIEELDAFINDTRSDAYEKLVDRLLTTDTHAERLAMEWLDVARYGDSHGVHADGLRMMWPWRDWVISSFKDNQPYDEFVTWQLAGDLLPSASREQRLATGFHRNHTVNSESGIVPEEFRLQYVADRTNTTAKAFMGLTMECAACHDHKFDPISQKEYYQMTAFFNNVHELGMTGNDKNWGPVELLPGQRTEAVLAILDRKIDTLEMELNESTKSNEALEAYIRKLDPDQINLPKPVGFFPLDKMQQVSQGERRKKWILDENSDCTISGDPEIVDGKIGSAIRIDSDYELIRLANLGNFDAYQTATAGAWINFEDTGSIQTIMANIGGKNDGWRGWIFYLDSIGRPGLQLVHRLSHNYIHVVGKSLLPANKWQQVMFTYDGSMNAEGAKIYVDGRQIETSVKFDNLYKNILPVKNRNYIPDHNRSIRMGLGSQYLFSEKDDGSFIGAIDQVRLYDQVLSPLEISSIFNVDCGGQHSEQFPSSQDIIDHFHLRKNHASIRIRKELADLRSEKLNTIDTVMEVMVLAEKTKPRKTHILERGQYDVLGEEVSMETPEALPEFSESFPKNRLGLAMWLFSETHPLTARVAVNRYWQLIFGRGLVETAHDFGSQGALPSHPELLDYLAIDFRRSGWNLRALLKKMVMSHTYRQAGESTPEAMALDPENIYLSRGPNYRWPAEIIRDNALAASGLLSRKIGGPSVKPYQPPDLWKEKNEFSGYLKTYIADQGEDLYRRSMYTFIRRTVPPPAMLIFDATDRAVCTVKRERTNTPLQALVLMNDPQFVEAARVLAVEMQQIGGEQLEEQIEFSFRRLCGRHPTVSEIDLLKEQYLNGLERFGNDPDLADQLLSVGEYPIKKGINKINTAALAMVNNTIMNFDETYMKR